MFKPILFIALLTFALMQCCSADEESLDRPRRQAPMMPGRMRGGMGNIGRGQIGGMGRGQMPGMQYGYPTGGMYTGGMYGRI